MPETYIQFMTQVNKMFIEKWYLVRYQIQDNIVYVESILDCRKDCSWLVK